MLFDCFACRQYVTCLERFASHVYYASEVENSPDAQLFIKLLRQIIQRLAVGLWRYTEKSLAFFVDILAQHMKLDAGMWRYHANRMDARRSQFDLGRVDAYI